MLRARQVFEKADPKPVAVLGPVPSLKEQIAELTHNPTVLLQMMQREDQAQAQGIDPDDPDWMDWDDDEPEILTGYEVIDMVEHESPYDRDNSLENQVVTGDNGASLKGETDAQIPDSPLPQTAPLADSP